MNKKYASAVNQSLMDSFAETLANSLSPNNSQIIDELLGDIKPRPGAVLVGKNGTIQWTDGNAWMEFNDEK